MNYLPLIIFVIVVVGLFAFASRARRRQAATRAEQADSITVGSDVMTTSGLYGTVVGRNDDDSVQLSIAPGVEVRWALAALRDVDSLPGQYRGPDADPGADGAADTVDTVDRQEHGLERGVDLGKRTGEPGTAT